MNLMFPLLENYRNLFGILCLTAFIAVGFLGVFHFASGMQTGSDNAMTGLCPFMNGAVLCTMNTFEHIKAWQALFVAVPTETNTALLILLAWVLFAGFFIQNEHFFSLHTQSKLQRGRYDEHRFCGSFFNPLQLALAKGRIHSKAY